MSNIMSNFLRKFWDILETVLVAGATVFFIRTFIVQPFLVSGASMEPGFSSGHYLLIDELTYRFSEPERGDVIVFRYPGNESDFYIKRVIGLPGEQVAVKEGEVKINGVPINEDYLKSSPAGGGDINLILASSQYFVLGDNRSYSFDSRNWGPLTRDYIIGKARLRLFPFARAGVIENPVY